MKENELLAFFIQLVDLPSGLPSTFHAFTDGKFLDKLKIHEGERTFSLFHPRRQFVVFIIVVNIIDKGNNH
jgi:hypothetical protein